MAAGMVCWLQNFSQVAAHLRSVHLIGLLLVIATGAEAFASDFYRPWRNKERAIVLDAYEYNPLDWNLMVRDKRIMGFIGKASDGLSPKYCSTRDKGLCGVTWRRYSVARELFRTRQQLAKALGLKWGSYHLGRRGNPELQANHYIQYADPKPDEVIVLDIEGLDGDSFMTISEAERFVKHLHKRIGRYPMLYTNHATARYIAANRDKYPTVSRLKLWYARYKPQIQGVFPMGNWDNYAIWQFVFGGNCKSRCPYRVKGTPRDIDVNVLPMTVEEARTQWPFDGLVPERKDPTEETETLMVNAVGYPEEEKHSDFVADADYNPEEVSTGAVSLISEKLPEEVRAASTTAALECGDNGFREGPDGLESC